MTASTLAVACLDPTNIQRKCDKSFRKVAFAVKELEKVKKYKDGKSSEEDRALEALLSPMER